MIVYHGSDQAVPCPDVKHSFRNLDFGKGFYATTVRSQAEKWARRKSDITGNGKPILNRYEMSEPIKGLKWKDFGDNLDEWIDFVCDCRDGGLAYLEYDIVAGKVANDRVYRVVDMYHSGIWEKSRALKEIRAYPNYDQIAFITQNAIDASLAFIGAEEVRE